MNPISNMVPYAAMAPIFGASQTLTWGWNRLPPRAPSGKDRTEVQKRRRQNVARMRSMKK